MASPTAYPITYDVDAAAPQNRLSVFFRIILVIPHLIILAILGTIAWIVTFIAWLVILFTGSYPEGMQRFVIGVFRWSVRATAYLSLLTGTYPPFSMDEASDYAVRIGVTGQVEGRNRLTVFFRIIMVIPHIIILYFLQIAWEVVLLISWFAALFTGSVPNGLHNFMAGVLRWQTRVNGYYLLLVDDYPPFSLS